ncbi:MAG: hypothetical protein V1767_04550 [Chloroflexota bacterium]
MAKINSVLGPIDTSELGFTLIHEHLILSPAGFSSNYPELFGDNYMENIVSRLKEAKKAGIDTILDATTLDLGRDVNFMAEASRRSGVNIIACAGWWLEAPRFLAGISANQFAEVFSREIEEGIAGTGIKAGILKASSDMAGVTMGELEVLRGVARAHLKTNVPIMLHSYAALQVARQQLAILKEEGVDLTRVKVDHANDTTDIEYLVWILEQGCYLGMDRNPGRNVSPLARTMTLKTLIDVGYAERLLPSHDWTLGWPKTENMADDHEERNPYYFLFIKKVVFPQLREMGVSKKVIDSLFVDNPRKFFEGGN